MKKFVNDIKIYFNYIVYSSKSQLKSEVANSRLNVIWWFLDPILFMFVYTFVVKIVFDRGDANFPVFVFIGLSIWNFFSKSCTSSLKLISSNKGIVSKIYIPKYILIFQNMFVNGFKMLVSFLLIFVLLFIYNIPITLNFIHIIPILVILFITVFAISCFFLHFGIFVEDLSNIMKAVFKLMFYMSGILYSIPLMVSGTYSWMLLNLNPIALYINEFRNAVMYDSIPNYKSLGIWLLVVLIFSYFGIRLIQKFENSYVKVI